MNRVLFFIAPLLLTSLAFGQTGLATVTGTITDGTGAVIANAPVSLHNTDTGQSYSAASSDTGNYTVSQVAVGNYDLTVTAPGFKTYTHSKFHLAAEQTMHQDVRMEVGQATQSVTVTAEASQLQADSSELVHNVTLNDMDNMPLMQIGVSAQGFRDPLSAVRLVPGVRYLQGSPSSMVINGTGSNTTQIRLDGMTMGNLENDTQKAVLGAGYVNTGQQGMSQPSVDAIQEVAVQSSNFAAEYGTSGGAVISMVTKSGTNQFHGSVYDYLRNDGLDAHNAYTNTPKNFIRQQDWGLTFGGPVRIPKLYNGENKTFFFFSFENFRNKTIIQSGASSQSTVPTPAYLGGDFSNLLTQEQSGGTKYLTTAGTGAAAGTNVPYIPALTGVPILSGTIFNPASDPTNTLGYRLPFVGNMIPKTQMDKTSLVILGLLPAPVGINFSNGQAGNNYQAFSDQSRNSIIPSIRIDQNVGSRHRVSLYLQDTRSDTPRGAGSDNLPDLITAATSSTSSARTARLNWDYTATPRLLLHFGIGWNDLDQEQVSPVTNYNAMASLGLPQTVARNFPRFNVGASANLTEGGMSSIGPTTQTTSLERRPSATASATYVKGRHTYKAGAEYRLEKYPNIVFSGTNGSYTFGADYTAQSAVPQATVFSNSSFNGFALASFELGGYNSLSMAALSDPSTSKVQFGTYLQDNWKITRKLTLDYGVRWDYGGYASEEYGRYSDFSPFIPNPSANNRLGARQFEATCHCQFATPYPYAIGPRLGAAYQVNRKTVFRAGIGMVYNQTGTNSGGPVTVTTPDTVPYYQAIGLLQNGAPPSYVAPTWPVLTPNALQSNGQVTAMPPAIDPNARPGRLYQWNATLQREISRDLIVEAAYVGNRGYWLDAPGLVNLNDLNRSALAAYGITDLTDATLGPILAAAYPTANTAAAISSRSILAQHGIYGLPYPSYIGGVNVVRASLLPFPQYSSQNVEGAPLGRSWYDSLQLTANKRYSHGLQVNVNYNYSKNLSDMTSPDPYNPLLGKGLDGNDLPQQLRITTLYQVPETRRLGTPILSNKIVSAVVSGWGIGLYLNYQSAALIGQPTATPNNPISNFLGYGPGGGWQLLPGADPFSSDWTDYNGVHHTTPIDINCHCFDPTKTILLNPAAWSNSVAPGTFAEQQQSPRYYRGFRFPQESGNMSRNFRFGHEGRFNLNVRVEFQNVFNRVNLGTAVFGTGNPANTPTKFLTGVNTGLYTQGFGVLNPTAGLTGARTGMAIGRLTF